MRFLLPVLLIFLSFAAKSETRIVSDFAQRVRILAALELGIKQGDDSKVWVCETLKSGGVLKASIQALELAQFGDRQPGTGVVIPRLEMVVKTDTGNLPEVLLTMTREDASLAKYILRFVLSESTRTLVSISYEMLPVKLVNTGGIFDSKMKMINVPGDGVATCYARLR